MSLKDQDFLWEIVYHAIHVPPGGQPPPQSIVNDPGVSKYVREWGRPGDYGFVSETVSAGKCIGAAWLRLFSVEDPGYGFVAADIPEISIALLPGFRNQGAGSALLQGLFEHARTIYRGVSLSVVDTNPAQRLYERLGFKNIAKNGHSITSLLLFNEAKD